jgi:PAS domain S-box-containing protein
MRDTKPLLLVDDEENHRDAFRSRLECVGFQVETATSGSAAFEMLQRRKFELVILDSVMPEMSGIDLLHLLRDTYSQIDLPVIMLTSPHGGERPAEALSAGANDYIPKPVNFVSAVAQIRAHLNRKWTAEKLRANEGCDALAAHATEEGRWDWDVQNNSLYLSPAWKQMLGYSDAELNNDPSIWLKCLHEDDAAILTRLIEAHRQDRGPNELVAEYRVRCKDGSTRWMVARGCILRDSNGVAMRITGTQSDATSSKAFDPLTGLPDRALFVEHAARLLEELQNGSRTTFAVMVLHLDNVASDASGQGLVQLSRRLKGCLRSNGSDTLGGGDLMARVGECEFAFLLHGVGSPLHAAAIAGRLQAAVRRSLPGGIGDVFPSASIGCALWTPAYSSPMEILRDAARAMQVARKRGGAQYVLYTPTTAD